MEWNDGKQRCFWCNPKNPAYMEYHDKEWGVPCHDDHILFEMLILEGFQAGLSWECVLNKRPAFREAFDRFAVDTVAAYDDARLEQLRQNPGIIRNKLKIKAARTNARVFKTIQAEWGSFDRYLWHWTEGKVIYEQHRAHSELSDAISKDLKKRGMTFVGTTIIYAYLQAVGVINSHEEGCYLFSEKEQVSQKENPILIKRIYEAPADTDGCRILVDRLWPRGIKKENAALDQWCKEIAPSTELRKWFHHEAEKYEEFCQRYLAELQANPKAAAFRKLVEEKRKGGPVTLLYSAKNETQNNAVVLREWLEK